MIREKFGLHERQAQKYLKAAREEVLKISEELKRAAIKKALEKGELERI